MNFFIWTLGFLFIWNMLSNLFCYALMYRFKHPLLIGGVARELILFSGVYIFASSSGFTYPETISGVAVAIDLFAMGVAFCVMFLVEKFIGMNESVFNELNFLFRTVKLVALSLYITGWAVQSGILP